MQIRPRELKLCVYVSGWSQLFGLLYIIQLYSHDLAGHTSAYPFVLWAHLSLLIVTMTESLRYLGSLQGHKGWVTAIATSSENPDMILTASRGKQIFVALLCIRF